MWMVCGALSVLFGIAGWILHGKRNAKAVWMAVGSLTCVSLTLWMEYRLVFRWVEKEDWSALLDVVPSMSNLLTGYVILMLLANIGLLAVEIRRS